MKLALAPSAISVDGIAIDPRAADAVARLRETLGSVTQSTTAGVKGSGRVAHWVDSGVVIVSQSNDRVLVSIFVSFHETDASPYPDLVPVVPVFRGQVEINGLVLAGGEQPQAVASDPRVSGYGGMLSLRVADMLVGLHFRKPQSRTGTRRGPHRLVQLSAEWGGLKRFPADH